jgi:hypothetical protein
VQRLHWSIFRSAAASSVQNGESRVNRGIHVPERAACTALFTFLLKSSACKPLSMRVEGLFAIHGDRER